MGFVTALLIIILTVFLVALAFDFIPFMREMMSRRGIGNFDSKQSWYDSLKGTAENWLSNGVPAVPKNAPKRLRIIEYIKGEYKVDAIQHWQEGSLLLAVNKAEPKIADIFIKNTLIKNDTFHSDRVDTAMLAYSLLCNEKADKKEIKTYMDAMAETVLKKYRRTGGIPYNTDDNVFFVDTIGLVCPFLIRYACEYDCEEAIEAAVKAIKDYSEKGLHKELGIPVHCYNEKSGAPLGLYGWGRGCGWWATGLIDSYIELCRVEGYEEEKAMIFGLITDFAERIVCLQSEDGAFDRNVFYHSASDSSATAMMAYFLSVVWRLTNKDEYLIAADKALKYLRSVTRKDGTIDYSQGDTIGVGFYSTVMMVVPATQGFALRACHVLKEGNAFD